MTTLEKCFSTYVVDDADASTKKLVTFHGRALKKLLVGQVVFLDINADYKSVITSIVTYGRSMEEIEPAMGCAVIVNVPELVPKALDDLYTLPTN